MLPSVVDAPVYCGHCKVVFPGPKSVTVGVPEVLAPSSDESVAEVVVVVQPGLSLVVCASAVAAKTPKKRMLFILNERMNSFERNDCGEYGLLHKIDLRMYDKPCSKRASSPTLYFHICDCAHRPDR